MNIKKTKIGNALVSAAPDHVVAVANDVYDEVLGMYQSVINGQVAGKLNKTDVVQIMDDGWMTAGVDSLDDTFYGRPISAKCMMKFVMDYVRYINGQSGGGVVPVSCPLCGASGPSGPYQVGDSWRCGTCGSGPLSEVPSGSDVGPSEPTPSGPSGPSGTLY